MVDYLRELETGSSTSPFRGICDAAGGIAYLVLCLQNPRFIRFAYMSDSEHCRLEEYLALDVTERAW